MKQSMIENIVFWMYMILILIGIFKQNVIAVNSGIGFLIYGELRKINNDRYI